MAIIIERCSLAGVNALARAGARERVSIKAPGEYWLRARDEESDLIVGSAGLHLSKAGTARYKGDYILKMYRGLRIYSQLWAAREVLAGELGVRLVTAFTTEHSRPKYLKDGFSAIGPARSGIQYVCRRAGHVSPGEETADGGVDKGRQE